jgi:hypothetical protein
MKKIILVILQRFFQKISPTRKIWDFGLTISDLKVKNESLIQSQKF